MEASIKHNEELFPPGIGIKDEFGNMIFAFLPEKILWWLENSPKDPACIEYIRRFPDAVERLKKII